MKTDDMKLFCAVAQAGGVTKAAQMLGVTPAAVSRRLRAMEEALSVQLVARSTRRFALTDAGRDFQAGCRDILTRMEALEDSVAGADGRLDGLLRINSSFGFGREVVAPVVSAFCKLHPQVRIQLSLTERPLDLVAERYDVGVYVATLPESRWHVRRLFVNRKILCASPAYLATLARPPETPQDLATLATIDIEEDAATFGVWTLERKGRSRLVSINPRFATNDGEAAVQWAVEGGGIVLRSRWAVEPLLASGRLVQVLPEWTQTADAQVCWAGARLSARARLFVNFLTSEVGRGRDAAAKQEKA